jgi:hypothetical protein
VNYTGKSADNNAILESNQPAWKSKKWYTKVILMSSKIDDPICEWLMREFYGVFSRARVIPCQRLFNDRKANKTICWQKNRLN